MRAFEPMIVEEGRFDTSEYDVELQDAASPLGVGVATLWFGSDRIHVWEVELGLGERGQLHAQVTNYFWTVAEAATGLQRSGDGSYVIRHYELGDSRHLGKDEDEPLSHDPENVGDGLPRFVTVGLVS